MKDADWYVDPLGRFDGRFFDGEKWTERVSDGGTLVVDPDFSPATTPAPAVTAVPMERSLKASLMTESPARVVAVLDDSVRTLPSPEIDVVEGVTAQKAKTPPRRRIFWSLIALAIALSVGGYWLFATGSPLDSAQEARVEDLEASGLDDGGEALPLEELEVDVPPGAVAPGTTFAPAETIEVGGLSVVNGQSMLTSLNDWHGEFAAGRGIDLPPSASCWFGQLGGAAVQVAFCGPVGGSADTEFLFDSVQVVFEETSDGQIAQPVLDAVTIDTVLANALSLVGRDEDSSPLGD